MATNSTTSGSEARTDAGRTVYVAVYDTFADWETGHLTTQLVGNGYTVRTVGPSREPVTTMGGLRVQPDLVLSELSPADAALLVLTGASLWDAGSGLDGFAAKAREFTEAGVPVAAICGATLGLARAGLLDGRAHTSAVSFYLLQAAEQGYGGAASYVEADAVTSADRLVVTAGPTEPVAFAREVLGVLGVYDAKVLDAWYRLHHDSDLAAYEVLEAAGVA
ncbi:DJ-1/PfpI family protein [Streptomyces sp. NPDC060194]|uniref:DJ-1/PfpI family protein n=1 Tax=Streptomyces sp. NPDC060194 TaxID=3347069 RepID=UPI00365E8229